MTEADEWRIRDIRIVHSGRTPYEGREEPDDEFLLRLLDAACAENAAAEAEIKALWLKTKPELQAQKIRADIAVDDISELVSDALPDYVWSLADVAAQRGINAENARILAMLRDPPEDVVEAMAIANCNVGRIVDWPECSFPHCGCAEERDGMRAALSALAGKIAEG